MEDEREAQYQLTEDLSDELMYAVAGHTTRTAIAALVMALSRTAAGCGMTPEQAANPVAFSMRAMPPEFAVPVRAKVPA